MDMLIQNQLSDDQWALIGCAAALVLCGTIMSLSYYVGRARQRMLQPEASRGLAAPRPGVQPAKSGRQAA